LESSGLIEILVFLYRLNNVNHIPIAKKSFKNVLEWSVEEIMGS
jgi:hypothetical protein